MSDESRRPRGDGARRGRQGTDPSGALSGRPWWLARAGYRFGTRTVVRCRQGHLFTTVWIPGASLKSLRLGWWRWQYCPVGGIGASSPPFASRSSRAGAPLRRRPSRPEIP